MSACALVVLQCVQPVREHSARALPNLVENMSSALGQRDESPSAQRVPNRKFARRLRIRTWLSDLVHVASFPIATLFLLYDRFDPSYGMTWTRKFRLAQRIFRNTRRIETGTSYKAHLAMAAKVLSIPPSTTGVIVECGCWQGGSTANLSLVCDIVDRELIVYDSFAGLPEARPNERNVGITGRPGEFRGELDTVREHVRRFGAIQRCTFRAGWFEETLPHHHEPIVMCFLDVDFQGSLYDCVVNLWPHLTERGYLFIDEYVLVDYCALFFSERFWKEHFDRPPPGLVGTGNGVSLGNYYLGPWAEWNLIQDPRSVAYTRKDFYGLWDYEPQTAVASKNGADTNR
jgi:Macrocin-O-methyltransferase (TylF)